MLRVLVADDDPDVRAAVEDALLGAGDQVFLAENGRQAVHAVRTMAFDVAVVDYRMPPLNGIDVLVALRKLQPACASVLLSGELNLPVVTEAINRGDISRILAKPASASVLLQTIEDAVGTRREQGQSYLAGLMGQRELERQALRECLEDKLDLARSDTGELLVFPNDTGGVARIVESLKTASPELQEKIASLQQRQVVYEGLREQLAESEEKQISLTDADARLMKSRRSIRNPSQQSTVDSRQ